jgi:hypothetical protein
MRIALSPPLSGAAGAFLPAAPCIGGAGSMSRSAAGARQPSIATVMPKSVVARDLGHLRVNGADILSDRSDPKNDTRRGEFATFVYGALEVD